MSTSSIDPLVPAAGSPAEQQDFRDNFAQTKSESEARMLELDGTSTQQELVGPFEPKQAVSSSSNTTTIDIEAGHIVDTTLTENTTLAFSNWEGSDKGQSIILTIMTGAGGYTVSYPSAVKWAGGSQPTITAAASKTDQLGFMSYDGGTTVYGYVLGQDFS